MAITKRINAGIATGPRDFWPCRIPLHDLKLPSPGEVHVWYLDLDDLGRSLQGALGSESESGDSSSFTAGQLLFARRFYLRLLLGAYLGLPGKSVQINRKNRGKPVLDKAVHDSDLHFSMAKSEDKLMIGFCTSSYLGVDLEPAGREARDPMGVARRYFSPAEATALEAIAPQDRDAAFLRAWACKEAVVKASGLGIANQFCRFTVDMDISQPAAVQDIEGEEAGRWSLALVQPEKEYLGAIASHDPVMKIPGIPDASGRTFHRFLMVQRNLLCLLAALLLQGCSLSAKKVEMVDIKVAANQEKDLACLPSELDRCATHSPVLEFGAAVAGAGEHHLTLIEYGEDALKIRIHLIRAARRNIELQNFILRGDDSGELILNELLDAARRGVKVRLLLDQMFSFSDVEYLVLLAMAHKNFEIRFYNPSFYKAKMAKHDWISGMACCFRRVNQRMHNKLLAVDDMVGLIGGRNIADRYFDFDTNYEFKDRDVLVYGSSVPEMRESFDWFWESPKTIPVQHLRDVAAELLNGNRTELGEFDPAPRLMPLLERIEDPYHIQALFVEPAYAVERLEYFSDRPRKQSFPEDAPKKDLTRELYDILISARHSVVIQSPYMVLSKRARDVFTRLRERNPDIELVFSTNSLASTDADTVYANTHRHKKRYVKKLGFRMYEFKPFPLDAPDFFPRWPELIEEKKNGVTSKSVVSGDNSTIPMPAPRTGLHSKSFVVDGRVAMIGSHNFDPRSEGFNTENGLVVWDATFAQTVEGLIRRDTEPQNSWIVAVKPDKEQEKTAMAGVSKTVSEFKPWSYGATSVYELAPGQQPVTPDSPEFYQNYYAVGSFPEVIRTRRQVTVLFLSSFFFFLEPIL